MSQSEPGTARMVGTLALAGLLSGLVLVGVYELTLPRIQANEARALREAVFRVLPGTTDLEPMGWDGQALTAGNGEEGQPVVYRGLGSDGETIGYAIPAEGPGFQDTIRIIYGYRPDERMVVGMEVLESRETPGLGDKIYKDESFVANFHALTLHPGLGVEAVPKGQKQEDHQVDCITGATISSQAVVNIMNRGNSVWLPRLEPGSDPEGGAP